MVSFVPPAPSVRTSIFLPGVGSSLAWSSTRRMILTWSAGVPTSLQTVGSEATGSEELLVAPQRRKVRQATASQGHAHRQIQNDLARVVHRPRPPPRRQGLRELVAQARDPARLGQQPRPGQPHRRNIPGLHTHSWIQPAILHREGVLPPGVLGSQQPALSQAKRHLHPVFNTPTMKTQG